MKLINWHKSTRTVLAGLLILGASTGVEARKGYLPRILKRNKAAAVEPEAEVHKGPMGRVVIPLNRLTAGDVERMLDDAYGRDNSFRVVEPSRLSKGVIVIGPKNEIDGIRELLVQADPDDRDYLIANKAILPEGIVSEEELEAELPDSFYAEARKNAEKHVGEETSSWRQRVNPMNWFNKKEPVTRKGNWRQRVNPLNWFGGDKPRNRPADPPRPAHGERLTASKKRDRTERKPPAGTRGHTAIKLSHADAGEMATQLQALYGGTEVRIVPVKQANIILVTGGKSETRDIHRSIVELDEAAAELSAGEIADATQYIRKMADSRNTAFRITRPHKPRIRPLPPISITGDPEPQFNQAVAESTVRLPDYMKPLETGDAPVKPKEPDPLQQFFEDYRRKSMDAERRSSQADALHEYYMSTGQLPRPVVEVHVDRGPQSVTNLLQYLYNKPVPPPAKPSGSSATYQRSDRKPISTKPDQ